MPRVRLLDPWGMCYEIATQREDTLRAWFQEMLPIVNADMGKPDIPPARIIVDPMWVGADPDWLTDSRVLGRLHEFPALNGDDGIFELKRLRDELGKELEAIRAARG